MTNKRDLDFSLVNWNIGGAKYLELPTDPGWKDRKSPNKKSKDAPACREEFQDRLMSAIKLLIEKIEEDPHVVTMQEVVQYEEEGDIHNPKDLFPEKFFNNLGKKGYRYQFFPLIDTLKHSAQAKWNKIKNQKSSGWKDNAYFAQGNAILVRKDVPLFPVWSVPKLGISLEKYFGHKNKDYFGLNNEDPEKKMGSIQIDFLRKHCDIGNKSAVNSPEISCSSEVVFVEQGLYFGDRNTEPRAAIVTHIVLDGSKTTETAAPLKKPLDLFIVNLHLTTLSNEREGIPSRDEEASIRRMKQLDIVFNDVISRYNSWNKVEKYKLRDADYPLKPGIETLDRNNPVWVVTGDFNFTPESDEYNYIIKRNFLDLILDHRVGTKSPGLGKKPTHTLDYAFAGPLYYSIQPKNAKDRIESNRVEVGNFAKVSDHMPLIVKVPIHIEEDE